MVHILSRKNSIANHFLAELRDVKIQQDSMRFRRNLERLGEIFAYEVSKEFKYQSKEVKTPLGTAKVNLLEKQPVLATILRAGIDYLQKNIKNFTIWLGDFDEELNKKAYIVPGLGDAGDLAYGYKT